MERLYAALQAADARFNGVDKANMRWYMDVLTKAKKDKLDSSGCSDLGHNDIQDILTIANSVAEHTRLGASFQGGTDTPFTRVQVRQWNLSIKDTLNKEHLSNEDTVCSPNHIELCKKLPLN